MWHFKSPGCTCHWHTEVPSCAGETWSVAGILGWRVPSGLSVDFLKCNLPSRPASSSPDWADDSIIGSHCFTVRGRYHLRERQSKLLSESISLVSLNIYSPFGIESMRNTTDQVIPRQGFPTRSPPGQCLQLERSFHNVSKLTSLCKKLFTSISHFGLM